jgi:hypothetical protein
VDEQFSRFCASVVANAVDAEVPLSSIGDKTVSCVYNESDDNVLVASVGSEVAGKGDSATEFERDFFSL